MAKIDIIIPIYNIENYLRRNLDSFINQSFNDFRALCVNDGSTDNCEEIIKEYVNKDERFVLLNKKNGGLSDARNFGLKYVDAKYVMFIDGDDYLEDDCLKECYEHMEKDELDMFVFAYNQINLEDNSVEFNKMSIEDGVYSLKDKHELLAYTPNAAWNKCYKTEIFTVNNIEYPFGYRHQDLGTTPKLLALSNKIGYLNKPLYNYILDRPNNITSQIDEKIFHIVDMAQEIVSWYLDKGLFEEYKYELAYLVIRNFIPSLRKAMKLKSTKFVYSFINTCFRFEAKYFNFENKYDYKAVKDDEVYLNEKLLKAYYLYKKVKG